MAKRGMLMLAPEISVAGTGTDGRTLARWLLLWLLWLLLWL
jgi:hypothetical protein